MADRSPAAGSTAASVGQTRSWVMGLIYLALAGFVLWAFGLNVDSGLDATFGLNPRDTDDVYAVLPDITVAVQPLAFVVAVVLAVLGGIQIARGFGKRAYVVLGIVAALFIVIFLAWAARGDSFSMFGMIKATLIRATPLTLGALGGILCERAAVINIAIEGMMLMAAFTGALMGSVVGQWGGLAAGIIAGALMGAVLAVLSVKYQVDQIIGGTFINIFALGITSFLSASILSENQDLNDPGTFSVIEIPVLSSIPFIGPLLFTNTIFVYLMLILVGVLTYALFRTRWGLRTRAVGEHPRAADTVGINVFRTRYRSVIMGGAMAGLAGSFLTLGSVGRFDENMTAGVGFIALAAVIFGRWHPMGAFAAALIFGFSQALRDRLGLLDTPIPSEFLLMIPYLVTILVVAGLVGRSRPPAADGQPYTKE